MSLDAALRAMLSDSEDEGEAQTTEVRVGCVWGALASWHLAGGPSIVHPHPPHHSLSPAGLGHSVAPGRPYHGWSTTRARGGSGSARPSRCSRPISPAGAEPRGRDGGAK
jgi:hypothetical protein